MGGTNWSDHHYATRRATLSSDGRDAFEHDEDVRTGKTTSALHSDMDPSKMKDGVREARDSDAHPTSVPVAVLFDVTGSMGSVPRTFQSNLCRLQSLCLTKGYLEHPAICVGAIGDATCDRVPFQVGQFESGNEIDDDLAKIYLEGNGGGQNTESYEIALYHLARHVRTDHWEKRNQKGYAFITGDETAYSEVSARQVRDIFGNGPQENIPLKDIIQEVQERWNLFFILPGGTSYFNDEGHKKFWRDHLGQHFMLLDDPKGISELIAATIGLCEDNANLEDITEGLTSTGTDLVVAESVSRALAEVGSSSMTSTDGTSLSGF